MRVPDVLMDTFAELRPDILRSELDADKCASILRELFSKQIDANKKGNTQDEVDRLRTRLRLCQEELKLSLGASEDIRALKVKAAHIMDQFTREKENAVDAKEKQKVAERRAEILVSHTEKLMKCLRSEATAKVKQIEANRRERKLSFSLTNKINEKDSVIATQKRLIHELREGAHIMEGQLRLMDERFYELRGKLDSARHNQKYYVDKYKKEAKELRNKFTAIHGPRYNLDSVRVPEGFEMQQSVDFFGTQQSQQNQQQYGSLDQSPEIQQGRVRPSTTSSRANLTGTNDIPGSQGMSNQQLELLRSSTGKKSTGGRAKTAPGGRRNGGGDKKKKNGLPADMGGSGSPKVTWGFNPSGNDDKDVDMLITKIYNKSKMNEEDRWTPAALTKLVADETGNVGCKIPDITPKDKLNDAQRYAANRRSQLEGK